MLNPNAHQTTPTRVRGTVACDGISGGGGDSPCAAGTASGGRGGMTAGTLLGGEGGPGDWLIPRTDIARTDRHGASGSLCAVADRRFCSLAAHYDPAENGRERVVNGCSPKATALDLGGPHWLDALADAPLILLGSGVVRNQVQPVRT
jgi:hypothetical protein